MLTIYHAGFWMFIALLHGLLFKPLMLFFDLPNKEFYNIILLKNITRDEYYLYGLLHLLFIGLIILFYVFLRICNVKLVAKMDSNIKKQIINTYDIWKISLLLSVVFMTLVYEIIKRGYENLLHGKRYYTTTTIDTYQSSTIQQLVVWVAFPICVMMLVNIKNKYKPLMSKLFLFITLIFIFLISFIFDNRGQLVFSLISIYAASVYLTITLKTSIKYLISLIVLSVLTFMTALRSSADDITSSLLSLLNSLVGRNFVEISKSIHIIKSIDNSLHYTYFSELLNPILLYIPRAIFPNKPVNVDTVIGTEVFGCNYIGSCAVPPGAFAQATWSAGFSAILVLALVLAVVLLLVDQLLKNRSHKDGNFVIFYFSLIIFLFIEILGSGYTSFLRQFIIKGILLYIIIKFVNRKLVTS